MRTVAEFSYKTVLLTFGNECPHEHYLDYLVRLTTHRCDEAFANIFPDETDEEKWLFHILDYAYIGARYGRNYKITKQQLEQLAKYLGKLHEVTEKICVAKIETFV